MSEKVPKVAAFKEDLKVSRFKENEDESNQRLYELKNDDAHIIRKASEHLYKYPFFTPEKLGRMAKKLFDEIETEYHIPVAPTSFVVAHDKQKDRLLGPDLFVITEKIEEVDISKLIPEEQNRAIEEYHQLLLNLLAYYEGRASSNDFFLEDVAHSGQYVYGKTLSSDQKGWYLVDTEPMISQTKHALDLCFFAISKASESVEEKFGGSFEDVRRRCDVMIRQLNIRM